MHLMKFIFRVILLFVLLFCLGGQPALASDPSPTAPAPQAAHPPEDAQSTTGPTPPMGLMLSANEEPLLTPASIPPDVPAYRWTHGCGPTAAGMVIAYWDKNGFSKLYPGSDDSFVQDSSINELIASSVNTYSHVNDYANPQEYSGSGMIQDNYLSLGYTPHVNDSLADFMLTSRSTRGNQYGWSYFSDVRPAFLEYVQYINSHYDRAYHVSVNNYTNYTYTISSLWSRYKAEIDAGRPVVFLVDSSGDGQTDHFITATGYGTNSLGQPIYRFNDTWDNDQNNWAVFRGLSSSYRWGVYGMVTFYITGLDISPSLIKYGYLPLIQK